jgi:PAS domain S-box-containing protein
MSKAPPAAEQVPGGFRWTGLFGLMAAMVLLAGMGATYWLAQFEDARMRSELLIQARMVAETVDSRHIESLSGSAADLQSPEYQHLKAHLKLLRSVNPDCRFIYLAGLKADGTVVFLVDSEAPGAKHYSPPGQVYPEASETIRHVFATGVESVAGPAPDRWGSWVSALVPLPAAQGVQPLAVLGMDIDARQWVWKIYKNCLPAVALTLLGLSGLAFLAALLRRSDHARRRIAASEARLAESEERYRIAAENAGQVIYDYHVPSGEIRWSGAIDAVTGYSAQELAGANIRRWEEMIHPDDRGRALALLQQAVITGSPYRAEYRLRRKDGAYVRISNRGAFVGHADGPVQRMLGAMEDVSQRHQAEVALRRSEECFRSLFSNMAEGVALHEMVLDATGNPVNYRIVDCNPGYEHILGLKRNEVTGRLATEVYASEAPPYLREYGRVISSGVPSHMGIFFKPMGRHFEVSIAPWGRGGFATIFSDVTERKVTEEALKSSEQKYRTILESIEEGYFELDLRGSLAFFNTALGRIAGLPADQIAGINYRDYTTPETAKRMLQVFRRIYRTGKPSGVQDFEIIMRDGRSIAIDLAASPILDRAGKIIGFRGLVRDISERQKAERQRQELEERLQRAQKMKAIGTLAGGVAHDLNNILSGIVSYPDLLLMDLPQDSPLRKPIETIRESGNKAAAIVQDLLTLARRGVSVSEVLNLNDTVLDYLRSPECSKLKSFHSLVGIDTRLDDRLLNIMGSPVHLAKTIMNLVSNAAEAMPDGGTIRISTWNTYVDQPIKGYDQVAEGDYAVVEVSDAGVGIPAGDLKLIFEPFFTKKKMGRSGTGLGMAVVWGTVKDHKGYIDVHSAEGQGTTFTLYFPVTRQQKTAIENGRPFERLRGRGETVLVVDDVQQQREIASAILTQLGYTVRTVASGEEAVDDMKHQGADLLILDMIMESGIDGLETYRRILCQHPGQRAIITSGYSKTERVKDARRLGAGQYLKKPYTIENLGMAVQGELRRP